MSYALYDDIKQLCCAVRVGDMSNVKMLLEFVIDINCPDINGETALHTAVHYDSEDIVTELILSGADVNISNKNSQTPLHTSASSGYLAITKLLLDADADTDSKTRYSEMTPLHLATMNGHTDIVELLIQHGADCNTLDQINKTPDFYAASQEITNILRQQKMIQNAEEDIQQSQDENTDLMQKYLNLTQQKAKHTINNEIENSSHHSMPEKTMTEDPETADGPKVKEKEMSTNPKNSNDPKVKEKTDLSPDLSQKQTKKESTPKTSIPQGNQTSVTRAQRFRKTNVKQKSIDRHADVSKANFQQKPHKVQFSASHEKMMQMNVFDRLTWKKSQSKK